MTSTSELSDIFNEKLEYLDPIFKSYGKKTKFSGSAVTLKCYDDIASIKTEVANFGKGKVLLIDGGGFQGAAVLDEIISSEAVESQWEGIIVYGNVRNSNKINDMNIGVKALGENLRIAKKREFDEKCFEIEIEGTKINYGDIILTDGDGIVIFKKNIVHETKPKF